MSDQDYYRKDPRGGRVALGIVGALLGLGSIGLRIALHERQASMPEPVDPSGLSGAAGSDPFGVAAPAPALPPIEFELANGDAVTDVGDEPIPLGDGVSVVVNRRPTASFRGPDFSFTYPPAVKVSRGDRGVVIAASEGASLQLGTLDGAMREAEAVQQLADGFAATGQTVGPGVPLDRKIAGKPAHGQRLATTTTMAIEVFAPTLSKHRRLSATLFQVGSADDLEPLAQVLATLTAGTAKPTPDFDLVVVSQQPEASTTIPAFVDQPVAIGHGRTKRTITVRHREIVSETMAGMSFDHAPSLSVTTNPNPVMTAVLLQNDTVVMQLMDPGMTLSLDDLETAIAGQAQVTGRADVSHEFRGQSYRGVGFELQLGSAVHTELFSVTRGARQFAIMMQFSPGDEAAALRLAEPVFATLH